MPLLRRRGNMASETDMRRLTDLAPSVSDDHDGANRADDHVGVDNASSPTPTPSPPSPSPLPQQQRLQRRRQQSIPLPGDASLQPLNHDAAHHTDVPSVEPDSQKQRRFSVLRFRNASDSQLSLRAKQQAEKPPPVPRPPAIVTTAPTNDFTGPKKMSSRKSLAAKFRRSNDIPRTDDCHTSSQTRLPPAKSLTEDRGRPSLATLDESKSPSRAAGSMSSFNGSALQVSNHRQSESSRSDASSADRAMQPSPTSASKRSQTSTFFKLRRTKKPPEQLFPMSHLPQRNAAQSMSGSSSSLGTGPTPRPSSAQSVATTRANSDRCEAGSSAQAAAAALLARSAGPHSSHSSPTRVNLLRERSSTMSSAGRNSTDEHLLAPTTRTSTSTGRKSFGDLFGLSRIRQNSELSRQGSLTPATPGSITSKSNSLQLSRSSVVLPERRDDESPAKYLARVEDVVSRGAIASVLSKGADSFSAAVLRSYMRKFSFFGDPMDMALRKLLMDAELPKETQQIDRCLQAFANRYHECNPGIYSSPDQAYFIAFSLLILHTDVFNKNNKHKMQKSDYLKNTRGEGIFDEILECFYDNISYTPFIHVEDDLDEGQERSAGSKSKKKQLLPTNSGDAAKRAVKEPIDPYTLILDGNLDVLRPNLRDAMSLDDHYSYLGTAPGLNLKDLQKTFFRTGVLQIVSARSRPDAFMSEKTATNPDDAHPGIVDIKVTKVGLLWRKEMKKRKARSPWQEWGAILTGAQLYFFRNTSWVKNLMHQYDNHIKAGHDGIPLIFKPPLEEFKPDALMSTQGAVALLDATYKKHKNSFIYVRQGGLDEVLLADTEEERNDWLAKLNYAAAFRTSGVRMRGVLGANYDGQGRRGIRRLDSSDATQMVQTPTGPVSIARGRIDHKMAQDIQAARRDGMQQKIAEADRKVEDAQRQLEEHLRNARHLQILAPIQPRSRDQLLLAAARMAAQLKWTRMDIWREKCHRDILSQDLAEDRPASASTTTPTKIQADTDSTSSCTPRPRTSQLDYKPTWRSASDSGSHTPATITALNKTGTTTTSSESESPSKLVFQTPPQSPIKSRQGSRDASHTASETGSTRYGSISDAGASPVPSPTTTPHAPQSPVFNRRDTASTTKTDRTQDEIDAEERDFLKETGLWEAKSGAGHVDKITASTSAESVDPALLHDRDRVERNTVRRSLQRTLRESAGHLSHPRGKKGKEITSSSSFEDMPQDTTLTRGTGSFVVHGKKASVINLGTELQNMTPDDPIFTRKHNQEPEQPLVSPTHEGWPDIDIAIGSETPMETPKPSDRRESTTSAGTATARSFRELHRRYSSAQAARSVSAGGRLVVPSDGESEVAASFSEGRKSPRPPVERGSELGADEPEQPSTGSCAETGTYLQGHDGEEGERGKADEERALEKDHLQNRPIQPLNA
ncbi:hypothetical protein HIM_04824 [Hirsutella minnesotensis 3608]|uniref:Protein transport protein sec73 n=1 Tax=Hirsutella minnesotensis 3608 TaxID=1043627 RepID=A0A0F8A0W9_9HYPO|nr:hypothetical protein HIM_04824 [Hirsutella minnesotensis 3608]